MALKAGPRSSFCPSPRFALGAQTRLWSGQTPKKNTQPRAEIPASCPCHYQRSKLAKFGMRKGKYREGVCQR